jgi:hypothetical protein
MQAEVLAASRRDTAVVSRTYGLTESLSCLPSLYTCYRTTKSLLTAIIGPARAFSYLLSKSPEVLEIFHQNLCRRMIQPLSTCTLDVRAADGIAQNNFLKGFMNWGGMSFPRTEDAHTIVAEFNALGLAPILVTPPFLWCIAKS